MMQLDMNFLLSQLAIHHHGFRCGEGIGQASFPLVVSALVEFHVFLPAIHFRYQAKQFAVHVLDHEISIDVEDRFLPAQIIGQKRRPWLTVHRKLVDSPWAIKRWFHHKIAACVVFQLSMRGIQSVSGKEQSQRELANQQAAVCPDPLDTQLSKRESGRALQEKEVCQPLQLREYKEDRQQQEMK